MHSMPWNTPILVYIWFVFLYLWDEDHLQCNGIVIFYFLMFSWWKGNDHCALHFPLSDRSFYSCARALCVFQECWKPVMLYMHSFLWSLAFGNSGIYCKWSHSPTQNQFSTETDWVWDKWKKEDLLYGN